MQRTLAEKRTPELWTLGAVEMDIVSLSINLKGSCWWKKALLDEFARWRSSFAYFLSQTGKTADVCSIFKESIDHFRAVTRRTASFFLKRCHCKLWCEAKMWKKRTHTSFVVRINVATSQKHSGVCDTATDTKDSSSACQFNHHHLLHPHHHPPVAHKHTRTPMWFSVATRFPLKHTNTFA